MELSGAGGRRKGSGDTRRKWREVESSLEVRRGIVIKRKWIEEEMEGRRR